LFARKTPARSHQRPGAADRTFTRIATTLALSIVLVVLTRFLPPASVLPALSIVMVVAALFLMAGLYLAGYRLGEDSIGLGEVAAMLMFVGCAGTMLSSSEQALALLGDAKTAAVTASIR
jgi:uncharacterized membrane protein YccC